MEEPSKFERAADGATQPGFFGDMWQFVKSNRKWWIYLVLILLLVIAAFAILASSAAAPFIYTLF